MRKLYILPVLLMILALILSACVAPTPQVVENQSSRQSRSRSSRPRSSRRLWRSRSRWS